MREATAVILAVLAVTAGARAAAFIVVEPSEVEGLFADRRTLTLRFEVVATELAPSLLDLPALGTAALPMEIAEVPTPASTGAASGDWTYAVTVFEREAEAVSDGLYVVQLVLDDVERGSVFVQQNLSDPALREGARVVFSLGAERPTAPLLVVSVTKVEPPAIYRIRSVVGVPEPQWMGVGGSIANEINPTLAARVGAPFTLTAENGDDALHNLLILDASGSLVASSDDVFPLGDEETIEWTPPASGTYEYVCGYHASMVGDIQVTV